MKNHYTRLLVFVFCLGCASAQAGPMRACIQAYQKLMGYHYTADVSKNRVLKDYMKKHNLTLDTPLYRVVPIDYVELGVDDVIRLRPPKRPIAEVWDIYGPKPILKESNQLGLPVLNVSTNKEKILAYADKPNYVLTSLRLGDVIEMGGLLYPDANPMIIPGVYLVLTIPNEQGVPIKLVKGNPDSVNTPSQTMEQLKAARIRKYRFLKTGD